MAIIDLDQKIKQALQKWRERNYEGASPITKRLLAFWFKEEHILQQPVDRIQGGLSSGDASRKG